MAMADAAQPRKLGNRKDGAEVLWTTVPREPWKPRKKCYGFWICSKHSAG